MTSGGQVTTRLSPFPGPLNCCRHPLGIQAPLSTLPFGGASSFFFLSLGFRIAITGAKHDLSRSPTRSTRHLSPRCGAASSLAPSPRIARPWGTKERAADSGGSSVYCGAAAGGARSSGPPGAAALSSSAGSSANTARCMAAT